eukprot:180826-Hanusia_phi.AAC.7
MAWRSYRWATADGEQGRANRRGRREEMNGSEETGAEISSSKLGGDQRKSRGYIKHRVSQQILC